MAGTAIRGAAAVLVAGAVSAVLGVGTASAATTTPAAAPAPAATAAQPWRGDWCDDWNRRYDRNCFQTTRWYWHGDNRGHGRWEQWRYDPRGHRWNHRNDIPGPGGWGNSGGHR
jgi:hypothetical protein